MLVNVHQQCMAMHSNNHSLDHFLGQGVKSFVFFAVFMMVPLAMLMRSMVPVTALMMSMMPFTMWAIVVASVITMWAVVVAC